MVFTDGTNKPPPSTSPDASTLTITDQSKNLRSVLHSSPENTQLQPPQLRCSSTTATAHHNRQLNLFPLHPDHDSDHDHHHMVSYLFSAADGGATSLTGLLGLSSTTSSSSGKDNVFDNNNSSTTLSPSVSLSSHAAHCSDEEGAALVRTAMRNKEREAGEEERWVSYSEVVEKRSPDEEVTSCRVGVERRKQRLALKLDYQGILRAWSDRGPLYIHAESESPQTVPDISDESTLLAHETTTSLSSAVSNVWRVPEMGMGEDGSEDGGKRGGKQQREASVMRYKEKRQNRLFSKTIRYHVRKLNADKRPRLKGRFVKTCR